MKRILTISFEFDDNPCIPEDSSAECSIDAIAYAMDHVNRTVPLAAFGEFVDANLDGRVLVDRCGYISDEVKQRDYQCRRFKNIVSYYFPNAKLNK